MPKKWDRGDWTALAVLAAVAVLISGMMLSHVASTGVWEDDGIYLATAKSLAEGSGYRHLELPGRPCQTKYPVLYPLVLSVIWRIAPDFPGDLFVMQLANTVFGFGAAFLAYWLARRAWRIPIWLAIVGAASAICAPFWVELTQYPMSEHLYAFLSMAALACLYLPSCFRTERASVLTGSALGSGMFAAAALLCRSIGVTVAVVVVATWLLRRRWREMIWAVVLPAVAWSGWAMWRTHAAHANLALPQSAALAYDLDYSAWMPRNSAAVAQVARLNSGAVAWSLFNSTVLPPPRWLDWAARADPLQGDRPFVILVAIGVVAVVLLIAAGLGAAWQCGGRPVHLYLALYILAVLIWPFQPDRMLIPLLPLLQILLLVGVWHTVTHGAHLVSAWVWTNSNEVVDESRPADGIAVDDAASAAVGVGERFSIGLGVLLAINFLQFDYRVAKSPKGAQMHEQQLAAVTLVRERTEPDAVVAGIARGYFFLMTGRPFVPILPFDDPVALYYAPDRSFWTGGRGTSSGALRAMDRCITDQASDYYRAVNTRYVLLADYGTPEVKLFGQYFARHPELFEVAGDAGPYRLWRIAPKGGSDQR